MSDFPVSTEAKTRPHLGRRASISRDELIDAALALIGPHRSISTISLREVAREAGIAPNSFYRHFRDVDELSIALIEQAGTALRQIIGKARHRASADHSVVRTSLEAFLEQLDADEGYLHLLLREGKVGSSAFKQAIERQLGFFEEGLREDLIRLEQAHGHQLFAPELAAKAITRLAFVMGSTAMDQDPTTRLHTLEQTIVMVQMIIQGARVMAVPA
jgi:AcrR family transcriptional regulator